MPLVPTTFQNRPLRTHILERVIDMYFLTGRIWKIKMRQEGVRQHELSNMSNKTQIGELKNEDSKNYQSSTSRFLF